MTQPYHEPQALSTRSQRDHLAALIVAVTNIQEDVAEILEVLNDTPDRGIVVPVVRALHLLHAEMGAHINALDPAWQAWMAQQEAEWEAVLAEGQTSFLEAY